MKSPSIPSMIFFCKFKESCKRKHYGEDCKDLSNCHQAKNCPRRHPIPYNRFSSGYWRFQNDCSYSHANIPKETQKCEHTEKIDILEKKVREITFKFIKVDKDHKDVKEKLVLHELSVTSKAKYTKKKNCVRKRTPLTWTWNSQYRNNISWKSIWMLKKPGVWKVGRNWPNTERSEKVWKRNSHKQSYKIVLRVIIV